MNMSEETIRELIREEIANAPSAMLAPRRETNPTPFAVGPVATMSGGYKNDHTGSGLVLNFAKEYETSPQLLKVFAHGEGEDLGDNGNYITAYKRGLYLICLSGKMKVPLHTASPWGSANMQVAINATDGSGLRAPGLYLFPYSNTAENTADALTNWASIEHNHGGAVANDSPNYQHFHYLDFTHTSITMGAGVPDIVPLEKDDRIRVYITVTDSPPSYFVEVLQARLQVMFLCPLAPTS